MPLLLPFIIHATRICSHKGICCCCCCCRAGPWRWSSSLCALCGVSALCCCPTMLNTPKSSATCRNNAPLLYWAVAKTVGCAPVVQSEIGKLWRILRILRTDSSPMGWGADMSTSVVVDQGAVFLQAPTLPSLPYTRFIYTTAMLGCCYDGAVNSTRLRAAWWLIHLTRDN